jgi:DNA-binding CsgD family transcriptional regulator
VLALGLYLRAELACVLQWRYALEQARGERDDALEGEILEALVSMTHGMGDPDEALALTTAALVTARSRGQRTAEARLGQLRALFLLAAGEHLEAIDAFETLLEEEVWLGQLSSQTKALLAHGMADLGRLGEAEALSAGALREAVTTDAREFASMIRAEVCWQSGNPAAALGAVDEFVSANGRPPMRAPEFEVVTGWALFDLGDRREPTAPSKFPLVAGAATEARAVWLLGDAGRCREAERHFLRAAEQWRGRLFTSEVRCLWGAGEAARRAGDTERARERLAAAETLAERHGLVPLLARVRRSLRHAGVTRRPRDDGRDGLLTVREQEVLELVAAGRTSVQIAASLGVAPSTVDSHVRAAKRKLGVKTRAQAALSATGTTGGGTAS